MGLKDVLATQGPRLALMAMAAKQGGPQALSAFMEGVQQKELQAQQLGRQRDADARAAELQRAQLGNLQADNRRLDDEQQARRLQQALALIEQETQRQSQTATDPAQAENAIMQRAQSAAGLYGLPPDQLTGMVPSMAAPMAAGQKKRAKATYADFLKQYGERAAELEHLTMASGEFAGQTFAQIREAAEAVPPPPAPKKPLQIVDRGGLKEVVDPSTLTPGQTFTDVPNPTAPGTRPDGLTPNAALEGTLKLRDRFIKETQAAQAVNTQLRLMKSSLDAVKRGAAAPGSQGVLVTFQKILDPTSVVRESEYARSASGLSLISRMEGAWDKIKSGGAGVPVEDLEQFVTLAEQFVRNQAQAAETTRTQIDSIAKEFHLKPENITRDLDLPAADGVAAPIKVGKYTVTVK